ncbi:MAG: M28 family peptidase [Candidatus Heimdallarchaeota archaeon]|nr:MAG: M28 family peptidase [Candidatus Heimdallarchaeota archaeon]
MLFFFLFILSTTIIFTISFHHNKNLLLESKENPFSSNGNVNRRLQDLIDFNGFSNQINETYFQNIESHIGNFSDFGSRYTGYQGYEEAINYIQDFFKQQNLTDIETISYPLLIPLDNKTEIELEGKTYTAHSLAPNSVQSSKISSTGLSGPLIYGGFGEYSELNGREIKGSIVVLEFNSGNNWLNAASLGAKAVIFLAPDDTDRFEAEEKAIDVPLHFPRFYIHNETTVDVIKEASLHNNLTVALYSDIEMVTIDAKNIAGKLPGVDDDLIIISSYFDSSSIVPAVAPGADEACGIATLLELIRIIRDNDIVPQKTIMFLALSGHNQAAAGAREFVYQNYDVLNVDAGIKLFLTLDISASNNKIGINPYGYLYRFKLQFTTGNNLEGRLKDVGEDHLVEYASEIRKASGYEFEVKSFINKQQFEDIAPITFVGDQEPFVASNVIGLSLFTMESFRLKFNTPFDLPEHLDLEQLKPQVVYSMCALTQLITEQLDGILDLENEEFSLRHTTHVGYGIIEGHSKIYNETTAWLTDISDVIVRVTSRDPSRGIYGDYSYITKTDENGFYHIRGISSSQPDNVLEFLAEAYAFNSEGELIKATNLGTHGQTFKRSHKLTSRTITINPTVFDCGTIGFFEVTHPYTQALNAETLNYQVLDPETRNLFFSYGFSGAQSVSLVFLSPNTPSVMVGELPDGVLGVYATNSSANALMGEGFRVSQGEFLNLGVSAFTTSKDLQAATTTYVDLYSTYNIYDSLVNDTFGRASNLMGTALTQQTNFDYSKSIVTIKEVQTWSLDAFKQSRRVIEDGTSTTIFFAILLIPFSFALSSLLFNFDSGMKRILMTSLIYGATLLFFYIIHPGLHLSSNIFMIIIGIVAIIFVFPAFYMIYQEGYDYLKSLRIKMIGAHFADTSRTSTILIAMSTGIARMKKRKGRTIIALSGIVLITFSLTLFTSASTQVSVTSRGTETETPYDGVYLRMKDWSDPLSEELLDTLSLKYGKTTNFSSRWWLYPPSQEENGFVNVTSISGKSSWQGEAVLGLTPEEFIFQPKLSTVLTAGEWFNNSYGMECVLSEYSAGKLNVNVNDTVIWAGSEFTVTGIVDETEFDKIRDYDSEEITPKNNRAPSPSVHIPTTEILILPAQTAKGFGASLYSISIQANDTTSIEIAETVSYTYGRYLEVRVGNNDIVTIYRRAIQDLGKGLVEMGIPLTIAILLMINTSISTVYESKKEIATFTSLGLAPFHIAGLFLAEFLVYAVIGSVIGYLGGITSAVILSAIGLFPESLAINYSSSSVVNALAFGIIGILLSTIYPLRISAKMSVPSVKRAWELSTSPVEDGVHWSIPLPFVAATEKEAEGIIQFLSEFFFIFESESVGGIFFAQDIQTTEIDKPRREKHLRATINLAPFDMGLKQKVDIFTYLDEMKYRYVFTIDLERIEGILSAWETSVRRFVDSIRKQLLIWRSLSKEEKADKAMEFRTKIQS